MGDRWSDRTLEASCQGKEAFSSPSLAEKVARRMNKKGKGEAPMTPYRCPHCNHWHISGNATRKYETFHKRLASKKRRPVKGKGKTAYWFDRFLDESEYL